MDTSQAHPPTPAESTRTRLRYCNENAYIAVCQRANYWSEGGGGWVIIL